MEGGPLRGDPYARKGEVPGLGTSLDVLTCYAHAAPHSQVDRHVVMLHRKLFEQG
jgi:hypothetical protein